MLKFVVARLSQAIVTLLILSSGVFLLARVTGSPASLLLPLDASPAAKEELERSLGLREPLYTQYIIYLSDLLQGDLGQSISSKRPAMDVFVQRLPATLELAAVSTIILVTVGIPLGILAALRRGRGVDRLILAFSALAQAMPTFWQGLVLVLVFGLWLNALPIAGRGDWQHMLLPAITLSTFPLAGVLRLMRSGMIEALGQEYVVVARAKGLTRRTVVLRHALRNALIPVVTFGGLVVVTSFMMGSVVVETIFAWPGVGYLAYSATVGRDFPVLQTIVLMFGSMLILANMLVDLLNGWLDPRIRA